MVAAPDFGAAGALGVDTGCVSFSLLPLPKKAIVLSFVIFDKTYFSYCILLGFKGSYSEEEKRGKGERKKYYFNGAVCSVEKQISRDSSVTLW
jgi:hypothetical protein